MQYVEIPNPDRQLLVNWHARQMRAREVMIRRRLIPWPVRRQRELAVEVLKRIDATFKQNAHDYWAKGTP